MADPIPQTGTPLPTTNPIATGVDAAISAGTVAAEQVVEKAAEASEPFLAFPVIKQLFEGFVNWVVGTLSKTGQLALTFFIERLQGRVEEAALERADQEVKDAFASGDPNAIAQAEKDFQKAQSAAANTDGSAHPQ